MKKLSLVVILCAGLLHYSIAQNKWASYSQSSPSISTNDSTRVVLFANIEERNDDFWSVTNTEELKSEILADTAYKTARLDDFVFLATYSNTPAYFFIKNVNSKNANEYEYRVMQDRHKIIVPWSPITHFDRPGFGVGLGYPGEMAYLGGYTATPGHKIKVDVRKKGADTLTSTAMVEWVSVQPVVSTVFTSNELNEFLSYLTHPWSVKQKRNPEFQYDSSTKTGRYKSLIFKSNENNLIFYLTASVTDRKQIEYEVFKNDKVYIPWKTNDFDNGFIWLKNLPYGDYQLKIRYTVQPKNVAAYDFIIEPAWFQTTAIKIIAGSLVAAFLGLIIWLNILVRQRRKANNEIAKKDRLQMELQIIRSQLNPHFIFNSLTSIQGLINKKDILGANTYLSEFAQLLRNTLVHNNREQIPLAVELKILETYLKLEQLRFNFIYEITVDNAVNINETEFPSLLLQPLLENAIVHGIANLKEEGHLVLSFIRQQKDMIVRIVDNGSGFNENPNHTGYGLKLTRERIELLNKILSGQHIALQIAADENTSTTVSLIFNNWFDEN
jgi:hypothetical protein